MTRLSRSPRLTVFTLGVVALGASLLIVGCSGGGGGPFIDPDAAAAALDELLPAADDLPGGNWDEISRNVPAGDDGGSGEFAAAAANEPACADLPQLADLGTIFDEQTDLDTLATANAEFERTGTADLFPTSLQMGVDVLKTSGEVDDSWKTVKEVLDAPETMTCLEAVFNSAFSGGDSSGASVTVKSTTPSAAPPQDGAAIAFDLQLSVLGIDVDGTIQIYLWPYGNTAVNVLVFAPAEGISDSEVADVLALVDSTLVDAAETY